MTAALRTAVHGMPRIGPERALKWALEAFWAGRIDADQLHDRAAAIRRANWQAMATAGIDVVPSNDFSLYDHVLDAAVAVGALPERATAGGGPLDRYFALARGGTLDGRPVAPLDLTKWFDTNYHHLVPEVGPATAFAPDPTKALAEWEQARALGIDTSSVLLGPLTLLVRSAPAVTGFDRLSLLDPLVDTYRQLLAALAGRGVTLVRLDEPALVEDRSAAELHALRRAYRRLGEAGDRPALVLSTYFGHVGPAMEVLVDLPVEGIGLDLRRGPHNLQLLRQAGGLPGKQLFAGVVDGRNVWRNDLTASLQLLAQLGELADTVVVSTSCSLLHVPLGRAADSSVDAEIRPWLAFTEEKLHELAVLARGAAQGADAVADELAANRQVLDARRRSPRVVDPAVRRRVAEAPADPRRPAALQTRSAVQQARLALPLLPTTTIGSFPQTPELRSVRAGWRAGTVDDDAYEAAVHHEIDRVVALQHDLGLDVLVHGEPERDDMVRYFASQLHGFVVPDAGWVQSYGSRCVRPPVLFGDVSWPGPLTGRWARYAQSRTAKPVKGMLTGPVTMLRWSFVRDDQPEADTAVQLALTIGDELADLQQAGIAIIQVDEPALREGLPLRSAPRADYLAWATRAFRLAVAPAEAHTQVHTHMCYAELGDIVDALAELEIDVVSLEAARSHMGLLGALEHARYGGGVGPGVYDVHSPRVPTVDDIEALLRRALPVVGAQRLWVNPDCGLKTRRYEEIVPALEHMTAAARQVRASLGRAPEP